MPIQFGCPECGDILVIPNSVREEVVDCMNCHAKVRIPTALIARSKSSQEDGGPVSSTATRQKPTKLAAKTRPDPDKAEGLGAPPVRVMQHHRSGAFRGIVATIHLVLGIVFLFHYLFLYDVSVLGREGFVVNIGRTNERMVGVAFGATMYLTGVIMFSTRRA